VALNPVVSLSVEHRDGPARSGQLHTPHGSVPTPAFMAVGTQGGLKGVTVRQARDLNQGVVLSNTYHLAVRPGCEVVHDLGGLHCFSGWSGPMLTDSGGYQVFSLAKQRQIDENGVTFRNHVDGAELLLSPEESLRIQRYLGADIIMAFDECPPLDGDRAALQASIERTLRWLERSVQAWQDDQSDWPRGHRCQALFGIVQGGVDEALRRHSCEQTTAFDLPGYAIGGVSVGEPAADRARVLDWVVTQLPEDRPRYLMGVGTPLDLVEAVSRGVDLFDCVLPTRMGRHGIAYTDAGPLHLKQAQWTRSTDEIDPTTPSEASGLTRGYLRHLFKANEPLGGQLVSLHNLAYYQQLMARMRTAIANGTMAAFAEQFKAGWIDSKDQGGGA
jgi:queuine tRNA-ribosyltransferase